VGSPVPASRVAGTGPSVPGSGPGSEASRKRVFARQEAVRDGDLPSPRHPQFLPQHVAVSLRRPCRDAETLSDFLVRAAGRNQLDDLALSLGEARCDLRQDLVHAGDASNAEAV
jgi:hypothetical protein